MIWRKSTEVHLIESNEIQKVGEEMRRWFWGVENQALERAPHPNKDPRNYRIDFIIERQKRKPK